VVVANILDVRTASVSHMEVSWHTL